MTVIIGTYEEIEGMKPARKTAIAHAKKMDITFIVKTLEGDMLGKAGDYLMTGIDGEHYPCDADIFDKTYEFIEQED